MKHRQQILLITSTLLASWLGMQAVHESGHILGALVTGGQVKQVNLHPLGFSRTDLSLNPHPLAVVWAGPVIGVLMPLVLWRLTATVKLPGTFILRFFAGFCLIANGAYIGIGSFSRVGDCGDMLWHGSQLWQLWLLGAATIPAGLSLWHRQGAHFGLGSANGKVDYRITYAMLGTALLLVMLGFWVGGV